MHKRGRGGEGMAEIHFGGQKAQRQNKILEEKKQNSHLNTLIV